jgi:plasmid maintenance system antidote protein VapI
MDRQTFIAAGEAAFGSQWQTEISRSLDVADRTVRRWISGNSKIPDGVALEINSLLKERIKMIEAVIQDGEDKF